MPLSGQGQHAAHASLAAARAVQPADEPAGGLELGRRLLAKIQQLDSAEEDNMDQQLQLLMRLRDLRDCLEQLQAERDEAHEHVLQLCDRTVQPTIGSASAALASGDLAGVSAAGAQTYIPRKQFPHSFMPAPVSLFEQREQGRSQSVQEVPQPGTPERRPQPYSVADLPPPPSLAEYSDGQ